MGLLWTEESPLRGKALVAAITSVCSSGFLLFGYDQGVMSGVIVSQNFLDLMGNPNPSLTGAISSLYDVGAIFGGLACAVFGERIGRRGVLMYGSIVTIIGAILQCATYSLAQMLVGRVVTGLGVGFICSICAVYQAEISVPTHRGWLTCCQLTTMLFGLMVAYWLNYGLSFTASTVQWRFPLAFQIIFAIYTGLVTVFLPDTPRWLMRHRPKSGEGLAVLAALRGEGKDHPVVKTEAEEIQSAIAVEEAEEGGWLDVFRDGGVKGNVRVALAMGIQFMQQMTGINIVTYYAPTLFQTSLGMGHSLALLLGCILQVWYVSASFLTWYTIDRVGRRPLLIINAIGMCLILVGEAICVAVGGTAAGVAAVVLIFLFEGCFTWGWMATVWVYPPEIMPLKTRSKGASLATAADFAGNFLVVEVTPVMLANIGYRSYLVWAVLNLANAFIVFFCYPETANLTLESVDSLFVVGKQPVEKPPMTEQGSDEQVVVAPRDVTGYSLGLDRITLPVVRRAKAMQVELKQKRAEGSKTIGMGDVEKLGGDTRVERA
ncbi:general substrate transporter [Calocera cornea HHB12733]|uniref:General substrate transporter n=1 Tax=Calocera cornea HHB12733 TaxID=1353952 RepID=A0A165GH99_9BASI|nr:general substrate transporter [Calocera cornea HHB12733]